MKKLFTITFTMLAVVSAFASLLLQRANANDEINNNFGIETLFGDSRIIDEVFEISAVRQNRNTFQRVVLGAEESTMTDIFFDPHHYIDERQIENRAFYRGTHRSQRTNPFTTENYRIMMIHNWPTNLFSILNTNTGEVVRIEDTTNRQVHGTWWQRLLFTEHDGQLYIIAVADNSVVANFYTVDFDTKTLVHRFSINDEYLGAGTWFQTNNGLYFYEVGGWVHHQIDRHSSWGEFIEIESQSTGGFDPETGIDTLTASGRSLSYFNFTTREFESRPSPVGLSESASRERTTWGDYVIFGRIQSCYEWESIYGCGYFDGISLVNLESGHRHVFNDRTVEDNMHDWGGTWGQELFVHDDYLVTSTVVNDTYQFIKIYDLNTMNLVYHGQIHLSRDQGLIGSYWFGGPLPFEIRLRD